MDAKFKHRYLQIIVLIIGILLPGTDSGTGDPYASQPRIVIQNGHLIFQTAQNHNISFVSTRGGSIRINNDDLVHIVEQAKSSTANLQQMGISSINDLTDRVNTLQSRFDEIAGLIGQLQEMQENYTRISNQVNEMYSQFNRMVSPRGIRQRVRTLENKVRQLNTSLLENNCNSNPCRNGATCTDAYNSFICQCAPGWQGTTCEEDVNECAEFIGSDLGCQNSATCINSIGSYSCNCPPNLYGVHCTETFDDCSRASHQALCGQGTCINAPRVLQGQPKYQCICNQGWTNAPGSPACIIDVDECNAPHASCSQNPPVRCVNLPGTFHCDPCPSGYTGNGHVCNDINECAEYNGGCSRSPMVQCINTPGSRICSSCPPGYNGDGINCYYIELCNINNGGCHPQATCVTNTAISSTYRECHCPSGFSGNGVGPNGCSPSVGTACESNPCVNGRCQVLGIGYRCICSTGYTGSLCDSIVDACHNNPCRNGGTCTVNPNGFACSCTANWQGRTCEDEVESCGGQFHSETGSITYPSDPTAQYQHGVSCNWIIQTMNSYKVLNLTFVSFNLEYSFDCTYDFLQINDGSSVTSRVIGRFCGNQPPGNGSLITTNYAVYLWFKSDDSEAGDGFQITWTSIDPVCGGVYSGSTQGSIQSPGYPARYPHNRDCYWKIEVPLENRIKLNIMDLRIEHHDNCSYDFLQIFDGLSEDDPILIRYCGARTNVPAVVTSGPSALIYFHTDHSSSDAGFHIAYFTENRVHGCGGLFTDVAGEFTSPRFPNAYYNNLRCEWLIRLHSGERIQLNFTSFDVETHVECGYDYVEVIDGEHEGDPIIGRYCNAIRPPVIISPSNKLRIIFVTDSSETSNGFSVKYTTACGGTFTALSGYLHSPNYPDRYPARKTCNYVISVPQGNIIEINFLFFDVESGYNADCLYDYLEIRDVSETGSKLARLCGNSIPGVVHSSYNQIWMKFVTDGSVQNLGFLLNYTTIEMGCGGVMTEQTGIISSPNSLTEQGFMTCNWLLRAGSGYVVKLNFLSFGLRATTECAHEYVEVFDSDGHKINRFCGEQLPPALTSTDNEMKITFRTFYQYLPSGFSASYIYLNFLHVCGGTFYRQSGEVKSPGYPNRYPHRKDCIWTLQTANNKQISLNVASFQLESHSECNYDFLEIRNGGYSTSPLVGKYCGDRGPSNFTSHSNTLWLHFASDSSMSAPGFQIFYESTVEGCGGTVTSPEGSIISPNYPQPYHHNADCTWLIQVAQGSVIRIFLRDVDIESESRCDFDFLQIFDGNSERARTIIKICGRQEFNDHFVSTGNSLYIKFRSDYSENGRGFRLTYQVDCNNVLKGHRGVIESPNFPSPYPHNLNCTWMIEAPIGNNVSIAFSHLILESSYDCQYDSLEIAEKAQYNEEHQIVKYCGVDSLPEPVITSQNTAIIRFISDHSVALDGFRLEWQVKGCGGHIRKDVGQIHSPNYPNSYPLTVLCVWYITVSPGHKIEFTVIHIDIETTHDCTFDYVAVYGGEDTNSPQIRKFCGAVNRPQTVTTHGNHMTVQFYSDYSVTGMGFIARFQAVEGGCGGVYTTNAGTLTSPNYNGNFDADDDCTWSIEVDNNHLIQLTIEDFDISPASTNCTRSYLAIYDGASEDEQLLLRHCGDSVPSPIMYQSSSNQLFLRMMADGQRSSRGFKASYITVCGAKIEADEGGEIMSLNYPHMMPTRSECTWILYTSDLSEKVTVIVTDLSTAENYNVNCSSEYVEIRSGMDSTSPLLQKFCGNRVPPPITSPGSALHISFYGNKFRATYGVSTNACGGTMVAEHGTFTSPDYPNSYPSNIECVWNISAPAGNKVQLAFSSFSIEESDYCNTDYVEIRQDSDHGNVIGKYCGNDIPGNISRVSGKFWIKFRSDEQGTGPGFIASYSLVHGVQLNGTEGVIESPGYPSRTHRNEEFTWTITVPVSKHVRIEFLQIDLEEASYGTCNSYVTISDGAGQYGVELQRYCTRTIPEAVVTANNIATVKFYNGYNPGRWRLQWTTVSEISSPIPINTCWQNIDANATNTTIISPGYPQQYENSVNCTWIINAGERHHVKIDFVDVDIDGYQPRCYYDKVTVYEALNQAADSWNKIGTVCGRSTSPISFSGNTSVMKLEFVTDTYYTRSGFKAIAHSECGGRVFASRGILNTSDAAPSYGRPPCEWVIVVLPGRTIRLNFEYFNIPDDPSCSSQYLLIRNGGEASSPFLGAGKYCNDNPNTLETSSNQVFIQLNSQYNYHSRQQTPSFRIRYEEISVGCGGRTHLTNDNPSIIITSPNHPNPPPHDIECEWVVMGPPNTRLRIDFNSIMDIEYGCYRDNSTEFVEIIDGGTINSDSLGKYCGQRQPSSIFSTSNIMSVRYLTSARQPHSGFNATIQIAECGGMIYGFNFTVTSPNYPLNYSNNMECEWSIKTSEWRIFKIYFEDIAIDDNGICVNDYVLLREVSASGYFLGRKCGMTNISSIIQSMQSTVYLKFKTNATGTARGFKIRFVADFSECGGELRSPSSVIQSPGFPYSINYRRFCIWKIYVEEGRIITFTFNRFNLRQDPINHTCINAVTIWNGTESRWNAQGSIWYCGNNIPAPIDSSDNTAVVYYYSYGNSGGEGFKLTYTSDKAVVCGGKLPYPNGTFSSPGFENGTSNDTFDCPWRLRNEREVSATLAVQFDILDLPPMSSQDCVFNYLLIQEGDITNVNHNSRRICGNFTQQNLLVSTPATGLLVYLRKNISEPVRGFNASYTIQECGGQIEIGTDIKSPSFPNNYTRNSVCHWRLDTEAGNQIKLTRSEFVLESDCSKDYVEIRNGQHYNSPVIGKYCGNQIPAEITSESNHLTIIFHSDNSGSAKGFHFTTSIVQRGCGGIIRGVGSFSSPTTEGSTIYPNNVECVWLLETDIDYHHNITFINRFDIEMEENCNSDYVKVEDYENSTWKLLNKFCGNNRPSPVIGKSNHMRVTFQSNSQIQADGFTIAHSIACGRTFFMEDTGVISSPGYPSNYIDYLTCEYRILSSQNSYITLQFDGIFSIEDHPSCAFDSLIVYGGNSTSSPQIGNFCGNSVPDPVTSRGTMLLVFKTDYVVTKQGFRATFRITECGGRFNNPQGTFKTPFNPLGFPHGLSCYWIITAEPDKVIELKFTSFDVGRADCANSGVDIYDSNDTYYSHRLGYYCGTTVPPIVKSSGRYLTVKLWTGYNSYFRGFEAAYRTTIGPASGCGGQTTNESGEITSPGFNGNGDNYTSLVDCIWYIRQSRKVIQLNFTLMDIEPGPFNNGSCPYDYLEIRDGFTSVDPIIGKYCGNQLPGNIVSLTERVMLHFHSDSVNEGRGFKVSYRGLEPTCGGSLFVTNTSHSLTSINYPLPYEPNLRCLWRFYINGSRYDSIELTFNEMDILCGGDYLQIREDGMDGRPLQLCGQNSIHHFRARHGLRLNFNSDSEGSGRGFSLSYAIAGCTRNYTRDNAVIYNPRYPMRWYNYIEVCDMIIFAQEGHSIALYFNVFQYQYPDQTRTSCGGYGMEVHEGTDANGGILGTFCNHLPNPVFSRSNALFIRVKATQYPGIVYSVSYTTTNEVSGCGGNLTSINGTFTSPRYPFPFNITTECHWYITVPGDHTLTLNFPIYELNSTRGCETNYLEIYESHEEADSNRVGRYCGTDHPAVYTSQSNAVMVKLSTSRNNNASGFMAKFYTNSLGSPLTHKSRLDSRMIYDYD